MNTNPRTDLTPDAKAALTHLNGALAIELEKLTLAERQQLLLELFDQIDGRIDWEKV